MALFDSDLCLPGMFLTMFFLIVYAVMLQALPAH